MLIYESVQNRLYSLVLVPRALAVEVGWHVDSTSPARGVNRPSRARSSGNFVVVIVIDSEASLACLPWQSVGRQPRGRDFLHQAETLAK